MPHTPKPSSSLTRLSRYSIDQVDADMIEPGLPGRHDGLNRLVAVVPSSEEGKKGIVEGLHPDVQSVDSQGAHLREHRQPHIRWIDFHGHFGVFTDVIGLPQMGKKFGQLEGGKKGGGAAADIKGVEGADPPPLEEGFFEQRLQEAGDLGDLRDGKEVAVTALGCAEGDVQIKAGALLLCASAMGISLLDFPSLHRRRSQDPFLHGAFTFLMGSQSASDFNTERKALWGMLTCPIIFMRFLPFFCFSRSLRFREISPP